ncbi:hypothetical protein EMIT079MI2_40314 [Bacillus sp. IT-79MI2]
MNPIFLNMEQHLIFTIPSNPINIFCHIHVTKMLYHNKVK